jgi:hypothetical protein
LVDLLHVILQLSNAKIRFSRRSRSGHMRAANPALTLFRRLMARKPSLTVAIELRLDLRPLPALWSFSWPLMQKTSIGR